MKVGDLVRYKYDEKQIGLVMSTYRGKGQIRVLWSHQTHPVWYRTEFVEVINESR